MPKKRHFNRFNKPASTVPASLASTTSAASSAHSPSNDGNRSQSVNDLLANLRRARIQGSSDRAGPIPPQSQPSVPPAIREILQLPETPAPLPRLHARLRVDANGRRLPAGPPPPRSWQMARKARMVRPEGRADVLPTDYLPGPGSLLDMLLRTVVANWDLFGPYASEIGLYRLPNRVREALIRYLDGSLRNDFTLEDLKAVIVPTEDDDGSASANAELTHLVLPASLLTSSTFPSLSGLLFPKNKIVKQNSSIGELQESWDSPGYVPPAPPGQLIPIITHLSLAISPRGESPSPSWKHLLAFSKKLYTVTHLSLAFWPEPMRTPNAKFATVTGPRGTQVQYGGTGPYSHSLDSDWVEAVNIVRTLSRNLYQLEYLDLTGCTSWFRALLSERSSKAAQGFEDEDGAEIEFDGVDWAGDWGKVETLKLKSGLEITYDSRAEERARYRDGIGLATQVEKHITMQRDGRGKIITVEKDDRYALRGSREYV